MLRNHIPQSMLLKNLFLWVVFSKEEYYFQRKSIILKGRKAPRCECGAGPGVGPWPSVGGELASRLLTVAPPWQLGSSLPPTKPDLSPPSRQQKSHSNKWCDISDPKFSSDDKMTDCEGRCVQPISTHGSIQFFRQNSVQCARQLFHRPCRFWQLSDWTPIERNSGKSGTPFGRFPGMHHRLVAVGFAPKRNQDLSSNKTQFPIQRRWGAVFCDHDTDRGQIEGWHDVTDMTNATQKLLCQTFTNPIYNHWLQKP